MSAPSLQRAFEAAFGRLGSSSTGQQLRRRSRACLSGSSSSGSNVRGVCFFSTKVINNAPEKVAGGGGAASQEVNTTATAEIAPSPTGGARVASRKKPMDGYLNMVCVTLTGI